MAGKMEKLTQSTKELKQTNSNSKMLFYASISFALIFMLVFASVTYAWVFATQFSNIQGVDIILGESQGLVMTVNGNVSETININNYLGASFSTFSLKEASSSNGRDLYLRDSGMYYIDEENIYESVDVARDNIGIIQFRDAQVEDQNASFVYFNIALESVGDNRYLIFDAANSYIKDIYNNPLDPVRVSLTFVEGETVETKMVGNRQEYFGNYYTEAIGSIDSLTKVGYSTNQNVETFAGYTGYNGATFDSNKTLYYLQDGHRVNLIVRIWLEGGDPDCTNAIAGSLLNIALKFDNLAESEVVV
jgi:hypothetical protein